MHPDLYALVIRLHPEAGGPLPDAPGHQAQALFYELVRQVDPDLSNRLHAARHNPFSVAVLPRAARADALELRVTLLDAALFGPFTRALLEQISRPALRLGRATLQITEVLGTPGSHAWAGFSSFAELAAAARPADRLALHFVTPTAFTLGEDRRGKKRLGLLPTPEAVWGSLARRWNELAPDDLHLDAECVRVACRDDVLVTSYRLQTLDSTLGQGVQKGFVGSCTCTIAAEPQHARALALLADAAFYLGVGAKTGRGMGVCRREREQRTSTKEHRTKNKEQV